VVFEPTGAYHRQLEAALAGKSLAAVKVNPRQARRFAQATGQMAKTDRVDAAMLARMGAVLQLEARPPRSAALNDLRELLVARQALIKDRTAGKNRRKIATQAVLKRQLDARLRQIDCQIEEIDMVMDDAITADECLARRREILTSIPGIGRTTASVLLIEMPELGTLDGKEAASLAGLAPISRQSGNWRGRESIKGGRANLRSAIYLPSLVATRHNPDLRAKFKALMAVGKPAKVALTAIMRKLVLLANTLLRDDRRWTEKAP